MSEIDIRIFDQSLDQEVTLSSTRYSQFSFPKHFHDHYTIMLVTEGVNEGFTGNQKYLVRKNQFLLINPADLHAGNSFENRNLKFLSLRIPVSTMMKFMDHEQMNFDMEPYFKPDPFFNNELSELFIRIFCDDNGKAQESYTTFLTKLLDLYASPDVESSAHDALAVQRARAFIHAHFAEQFSLAELSQAALQSPYHLIRAFKKHQGLTPFQYLRNVRIEKAKTLLPGRNISEVAHAVGFFDHSHFLRAYKSLEGGLPSHLKRNSSDC